jgi:hypothetical protein
MSAAQPPISAVPRPRITAPDILIPIHTIPPIHCVNPGKNFPFINTDFMKNADRPFIGIIIVTIAVLYSVIALLS